MSTQKDDGGPAFPFKCQGLTTAPEFYYGMSLRDWFSGQALNALASWRTSSDIDDQQNIATVAYELADAMIAARKEKV